MRQLYCLSDTGEGSSLIAEEGWGMGWGMGSGRGLGWGWGWGRAGTLVLAEGSIKEIYKNTL